MNALKNWYQKLFQENTLTGQQQGAALVVTLLVMLVLVLLALSIILQSQTEYTIAVNEQDAFTALGYGEASLDWLNKNVRDYATSAANPTDLDDYLNGVDNASSDDDNLPELTGRTLDLTKTSIEQLTDAEEENLSVKIMKDFGDGLGAVAYEAFRVGDDTNQDGLFDGNTRGVIYIRVDDNYDNGAALDVDDDDWRMRARVVAEYPRWTNSDGTLKPVTGKQHRTVAVRKLVANFEPAGKFAIRTQGDLDIQGSLQLCGECGGAHANGTLTVNLNSGAYTCADVSGTEGLNVTNSAGLTAPASITGPVYIPVINPYDDRYVPNPAIFDRHNDDTLLSQLQCPGTTASWDPTKDPGATKYFSMVLRKVNNQNYMRIYKAYWDNTNLHWVWRLIEEGESNSPNMGTLLDNCGRVVSGTLWDDDGDATNDVTLQADPIPLATDVAYWGADGRPASAGIAVSDAADKFYGFDVAHNQGYDLDNCTDEDTLTGTDYNDFTLNDYWRTAPNPFSDDSTSSAYIKPSDYTRNSSVTLAAETDPLNPTGVSLNQGDASLDPPLPGTVRYWATALSVPDSNADSGVTPSSSRRDFVYTLANGDGNNSTKWSFKGSGAQDVYSPLWGSVVFVYGNLDANSGSNLNYVNDTPAQATLAFTDAALDNRWRVTFLVFGYLELHGNPIYGPVSTSLPFTAIAGRDIYMRGTGGSSHGGQDTCPTGTDCTADPPTDNGFEGMILAHEEVTFNGNVQVDGFIIAEDASTCINVEEVPNLAGGSVQIHYDCNNPPDPWGDKSVRIASWEEVQY